MGEKILLFKNDTIPVVPTENQFVSESDPVIVVDKFELVIKEIDKLLSLQENWDGQGGCAVLSAVGETAKKLISIIEFVDGISDVLPNPHGTLTIEWTNGRKEKLALEIGANTYSYFVKFSDKKPKLVDGQDILMDYQNLAADLGELFSEEILNFVL